MRVRLSAEARRDLIATRGYIHRHNPTRARSFIAELVGKCESLAALPEGYPVVPCYEKQGVRRCAHGDYSIPYRVAGKQVFVLHALHGARDYDAILR